MTIIFSTMIERWIFEQNICSKTIKNQSILTRIARQVNLVVFSEDCPNHAMGFPFYNYRSEFPFYTSTKNPIHSYMIGPFINHLKDRCLVFVNNLKGVVAIISIKFSRQLFVKNKGVGDQICARCKPHPSDAKAVIFEENGWERINQSLSTFSIWQPHIRTKRFSVFNIIEIYCPIQIRKGENGSFASIWEFWWLPSGSDGFSGLQFGAFFIYLSLN